MYNMSLVSKETNQENTGVSLRTHQAARSSTSGGLFGADSVVRFDVTNSYKVSPRIQFVNGG